MFTNSNYFRDVAKLGESLVLPPEIHPIYLEKEFIPADTEDSGIPKVHFKTNSYLASAICVFGLMTYSVTLV